MPTKMKSIGLSYNERIEAKENREARNNSKTMREKLNVIDGKFEDSRKIQVLQGRL
ncbi:hypothetical protein LguiA_030604 [Lonicera macranthoides]